MSELVLLLLAVAFFARRSRGKGPRGDALAGLLDGAAAAGIITATQREQLLAYAATHEPAGGRLGGVAWLGVFAGLFVVAGVSLLIARNWEDIGPILRVGAFLALLLAVGEAAIRTRDRSLALGLPLELLWFFLPLLGIGLYGQTFQLTGDPLQPFLAWLALGAPLAWLSARPVVAILHTFALVGVLFFGNYVVDAATIFIGGGMPIRHALLDLTGEPARLSAWALSIGILVVIAVQSLRLLPAHHRHHFVGVVVAWVFVALVAPTPIRVTHPGWIVVAAVALATLWMAVLAFLQTSLEERAPAATVWLGTLYGLTFTWHLNEAASGEAASLGVAVIAVAATVAVAAVLLLPGERLSPLAPWARAAKALLVLPLLIAMLYVSPEVDFVRVAAAAMNVLVVTIAVGLMWHGSLLREPAQVNAGVVVLVAMLITRFLDVFGSMLQSGIGFIAAGLALAALAFALERTRRRLLGASS